MIYSEHATGCVLNAEDYLSIEDFMVMVIGLAYMNGFDVDLIKLSEHLDKLSDATEEDIEKGLFDELDETFNQAFYFLESDAPEGYEWKLENKALFLNKIG